jgi:post-segregation antitoxin (ccd killing protein)
MESTVKSAGSTAHAARTQPKNSTNIILARNVYLDVKNFDINISQVCKQRLREEIQLRKEQQWMSRMLISSPLIQAHGSRWCSA